MSNNIFDYFYDDDEAVQDLIISNGEIVLSRGALTTTQHVEIMLNTQLTEWFIDQSFGIPWLKTDYNFANDLLTALSQEFRDGILGSNFDASSIRGILEVAILKIPAVTEIRNMTLDVDKNTGLLDIDINLIVEKGIMNTTGTNDIKVINTNETSELVTINLFKKKS